MIEYGIDYLAGSIPDKAIPISEQRKPAPPLPFYKRAYTDENGIYVATGHPKTDRAYIALSGSVLDDNRAAGLSDVDNLQAWLSDGLKPTRIDLQVTQYITGDLITIDDVIAWWSAGKITVPKAWRELGMISAWEDGNMHGETLYFGNLRKRAGKGIARVYDKGQDLGIGRNLMTRFEIEDRRDKADVTARRVVESGVLPVLRTRFDVLDERWEAMLNAPIAPMTRAAKSTSDKLDDMMLGRWQWLIEQVAPSLGEALAIDEINGRNSHRELFEREMKRAYAQKLSELKRGGASRAGE